MTLTQKKLIDLFEYCPDSGLFVRRLDNKTMTSLNTGGFVFISIDQYPYTAHRLAWLYVYGEFPKGHLTHKDGDKTNNSINNLVLPGSPESLERTRQEFMEAQQAKTPEEMYQFRYNARLGKLLGAGYKIEGNHLVRSNGEDGKTYLLMYDRYIRDLLGEK